MSDIQCHLSCILLLEIYHLAALHIDIYSHSDLGNPQLALLIGNVNDRICFRFVGTSSLARILSC